MLVAVGVVFVQYEMCSKYSSVTAHAVALHYLPT